jgi:hypothetical protein
LSSKYIWFEILGKQKHFFVFFLKILHFSEKEAMEGNNGESSMEISESTQANLARRVLYLTFQSW